jgi:hypothetical protein
LTNSRLPAFHDREAEPVLVCRGDAKIDLVVRAGTEAVDQIG